MKRFRDRREETNDEEGFEEEESGEGGRQQKIFRKKDFRDLNPKDKKARKEPKKPWGRGERLLVLTTIIITAGLCALLYFLASDDAWSVSLPKFKAPQVKIQNPFAEETYIYRKGN